MNRSSLAARLIRARNNTERKKLLALHPAIADARLARELANHCYRVWAAEPVGAQRAAAAIDLLDGLSGDDETRALRFWVDGIADITKGKLESAVENLDSASKLLLRIGHEHESAQPQVARLIALAMLGRYDQAKRAGDKALNIFGKYDDQLAAGKIEMNLSNIVSRRDQYRAAERYCLSAHRRFQKLGERSWQTMAENGLANTYAELNDFKRAEKFYERALKNARAARMRVTIAEIEASMGNLEFFRGRYAEALRWLELSRQKYEKLEMPAQTAVSELEIADIYSELNLASEAIELYQKLVPSLHRLKLRAEEARARASFGRVLMSVENTRQASRELKRAAKLFDAEKNFIAAAAVNVRRSALELSQGRPESALALADAASATLESSENVRLRLSAMLVRAEILAMLGRSKNAEAVLHNVREAAVKNEQPAIAQAAMNLLGVIAQQAGRIGEAEDLFESSIAVAEAARAPLPGEEFRMAFQAKSLAPYENLWQLHLSAGNRAKAFTSVERARARTLLDALGHAKRTTSNAAVSELREELNWMYSRAARTAEDEAGKLQKDINQLEKKLAALELRVQSTSRARRRDGSRVEFDVESLQSQLGSQRVLIEFVERAGKYSAFVITDSRVEYIDAIATEDEITSLIQSLHFQFGSLRFGAAAMREFAGQLKSRTDQHLNRLHEKLLLPLAPFLDERDLVIVPAGVLNYVPFHALHDGTRYEIEVREIVYSPSAAVWQKLNSKPHRPSANALLMAYADERIPLATEEVESLAKFLPGSKLSGRRATFSAFVKNAPNFDLIHLACHGQFRPDNPLFSSLHLADGWVTVRDVTANRINAQLVTLSACETGLSKIFAGEEILGLARGFLSAGARSLMLSLWTVNDAATSQLMQDFYRSHLQRGLSVPASLRIAQMNFIKRGEHPYYWSPFFLIG